MLLLLTQPSGAAARRAVVGIDCSTHAVTCLLALRQKGERGRPPKPPPLLVYTTTPTPPRDSRIQCYDCNSEQEPRCRDPFNHSEENLPTLRECQGCCVKIVKRHGKRLYISGASLCGLGFAKVTTPLTLWYRGNRGAACGRLARRDVRSAPCRQTVPTCSGRGPREAPSPRNQPPV
ncbi:hypothetical protein HPB50_002622 [Hyalomma asiaticum]|uniref:Uncharacterized protein n=1 Tax=Hyalomma asiaticum TaxID=266040 RepID=A0ACB7S4W9_HYAAI|nr:hypothetical protein HPB50_002622 [Hyalomma asiaticum]